MFLIILMIVITGAISCSAAFFSVFGLAQTFAAARLATIIMGASLEAGKLVAASFLYQYWSKIGIMLKSVLVACMLGLMCLTSYGIFGFLSAAYQKDTINLKDVQQQVEYFKQEKIDYTKRLTNIDEQIKNVPSDHINKKIQLIKTLNTEKGTILTNLKDVNDKLEPLLTKNITSEAKVGPVIFVAKALNVPVDKVTLYLIFCIMAVFDTSAVALTIGTNLAIKERRKAKAAAILAEPLPIVEEVPLAPVAEKEDNSVVLNDIMTKLDEMHTKLHKPDTRADVIQNIRNIDN